MVRVSQSSPCPEAVSYPVANLYPAWTILFVPRPSVHTQGGEGCVSQIQHFQSFETLKRCHLLVTLEMTNFKIYAVYSHWVSISLVSAAPSHRLLEALSGARLVLGS